MSRSVRVISAISLWTALLSGNVQAQSCVQLCNEDFWQTATREQILAAIANEGVTARDKDGWMPLHMASALGTPESVGILLEAGADIESPDQKAAPHSQAHF